MQTTIDQIINERLGINGHYCFIEADPSKARDEYQALLSFLASNPLSEKDTEQERVENCRKYRILSRAYHAKATVAVHEFDNLVPTVGASVLAQRLSGTLTYTGTLNYAAIGSGVTTPAAGDTQLGTEVYRQTFSTTSYVNNIAYLSCFIAAGSATGTHTEGGLFIDGTASANTGQIFSHVLFSPSITKAALNSLTLDVTITIT